MVHEIILCVTFKFYLFPLKYQTLKFCLQFFRGGCTEQQHMYHRSWDRSWTRKPLKNLVSISWTKVLSAFGQASIQRLRALWVSFIWYFPCTQTEVLWFSVILCSCTIGILVLCGKHWHSHAGFVCGWFCYTKRSNYSESM